MLLGALDYYGVETTPALQIVPQEANWTIDVPDMTKPWSPAREPAWRWLGEDWDLPIPEGSVAVTHLAALRGARITEAARWEEDEWELFAGPGSLVQQDEIRVVPLGTLLGADESLTPVLALEVGEAVDRDPDSDWRPRPKQ